MSPKDCGKHSHCRRRKLFRRVLYTLLTLILIILLIILIVYLVLRPQKPRFVLSSATIYAFNLSSPLSPPSLLTSSIQVTISSHNPNDRIGIRYDRLDVYASYKSQQITLPTSLPPTYQGHNDVNVWSPFIYGSSVPLAPFLSVSLAQDINAGIALIHVKIDGRLRWKVGSWTSGHYHVHVNCPTLLSFGGGGRSDVKLLQMSVCTVDV
ncbi:hypothetical protein QJS04_geneDACA008598 [Acorus gramineus]|uniref:Late embryogenesis abundant protein LEA-2 subgroup domain-containing protein n=1 Tax=Acorus gramineus TaxID=55184 RepID=A0AAV9AJ43_ACOGR|nr:hypothetical protein QJS04_geneDACA008598 [Acorus gramineus]